MRVKRRLSGVTGRVVRFIEFRVLHVDDSPRNLAMGVGVGLFFAWLPMIGFQMAVSLLAAVFLRANKFLALSLVWVSNVFTLVPIYFSNYLVGLWIVNILGIEHGSSREEAIELMRRLGSFGVLVDVWRGEFWLSFFKVMVDIGLPLWIGSFVVGSVVGVVFYFLTYRTIVWYRLKNPRRRYKKHKM